MKPYTTHSGRVIPLPMHNVDTDMIIPAHFLKNITREGYTEALFQRLREQDPAFPFNDPKFEGASVLVADTNFGCGSSREHAVWALHAGGIRVVIAKSFADIFFNNAAKNGLLLVTLDAPSVDTLLATSVSGVEEVTVDLEAQEVIGAAIGRKKFFFDAFRRYCLLEGVDELDYILSNREALEGYFGTKRDFIGR